MANQRFRGKCPHCGKLTSESFSTSLVLDRFALTCHWCSKPYESSSSQIIFEKGLQDQVDNPINTSSKIYFNETPLAEVPYTPGMPITEGLINDSRPSSLIFSGDNPLTPHFTAHDSSTIPPKSSTGSLAFYDPVIAHAPITTCQHEGEVYYSIEEDNYYCADCNQGMGNAYYKLAKRLEAKKKPQPKLLPRPKLKLGQRKVQKSIRGDTNEV